VGAVDGGYQFHDWAKWQPTRGDVEKKRAEDAERKAEWRRRKAEEKAAREAAEAEMSQRDSARTDAVTPRGVRSTRPDPTRPDPTRTSPTEMSPPPENSVKGGSHVSNASDPPPLYPDHCTAHAFVAVPGNCGDCADMRKALAARPTLTLVAPTQRCLVHMEPDVTNCRGCAADRKAAS
jgi:hypothetical protein